MNIHELAGHDANRYRPTAVFREIIGNYYRPPAVWRG